MKKVLVFLIIGLLLIMTLNVTGADDCGCDKNVSSDNYEENVDQKPWLTSEDIERLSLEGQQKGWTFTVGETPATQRSFSQLCGLVEPENWALDAEFDPYTGSDDLPPHFDWRELGGCTPIKDQDGCGSCWAFGSVAPLECNILIKDKAEVDLSEQWLVSCNRDGWGCQGGWFAHNYFQWKADPCNGTGAVLEEDFPYEARNLPCDCPYSHRYYIDSWKFIGFGMGIPSVNSTKQAIMKYGPISCAVAVNHAFGAYTGGVFNDNSPANINHAVALVGWDDNQGTNGIWFLRNSWGEGWGEGGYMRIEYGCCKIGYAACYVDYPVRTQIEFGGGPFGLKVYFKNVGDQTSTNIKWSITMTGGIHNKINVSLESMYPSLEPGENFFRRIPRFGFGLVDITVTADPDNAGKVSKNVKGFLLGLLLILKTT